MFILGKANKKRKKKRELEAEENSYLLQRITND